MIIQLVMLQDLAIWTTHAIGYSNEDQGYTRMGSPKTTPGDTIKDMKEEHPKG